MQEKLTFEECEKRVVQFLAGNDVRHRNKGIKKMKMLLQKRPMDCTNKMAAYWKGLHYCMWMCDKPINQEDLADSLSSIIELIKDNDCRRSFVLEFFHTEAREWQSLDQHRTDKYLMLVRRFFRACLRWLDNFDWPGSDVEWFCSEVLSKQIFRSEQPCMGLQMFIVEMVFDELKAYFETKEDCPEFHNAVELFIRLFCQEAGRTSEPRLMSVFAHEVFDQFVLGFAALLDEKQKNDDAEWSIPLSVESISKIMFEEASHTECRGKNRKKLYSYVKQLEKMQSASADKAEKDFWESVHKRPNVYNLRLEPWAGPKGGSNEKSSDDSDDGNEEEEEKQNANKTKGTKQKLIENKEKQSTIEKDDTPKKKKRIDEVLEPLWSFRADESKTGKVSKKIKGKFLLLVSFIRVYSFYFYSSTKVYVAQCERKRIC